MSSSSVQTAHAKESWRKLGVLYNTLIWCLWEMSLWQPWRLKVSIQGTGAVSVQVSASVSFSNPTGRGTSRVPKQSITCLLWKPIGMTGLVMKQLTTLNWFTSSLGENYLPALRFYQIASHCQRSLHLLWWTSGTRLCIQLPVLCTIQSFCNTQIYL